MNLEGHHFVKAFIVVRTDLHGHETNLSPCVSIKSLTTYTIFATRARLLSSENLVRSASDLSHLHFECLENSKALHASVSGPKVVRNLRPKSLEWSSCCRRVTQRALQGRAGLLNIKIRNECLGSRREVESQ